jgi:DNA-binding transcriptional LysR family regulator
MKQREIIKNGEYRRCLKLSNGHSNSSKEADVRTRYKDLSLSQLRTFQEVCRRGGYAAAARRLRLSTSAVWEQVHGLERFVDLPLLESRGRRLRPTPEGRQLLQLIGPHVAGLDAAREALQQLRGRPPQSLTLVSGVRMLTDEVVRAVAKFHKLYPDTRVRLLYAPDRQIDAIVEQGEADLGLVIERAESGRLHYLVVHEPAYEFEFVLVTRRGHPLAVKRSLRVRDLIGHRFVLGAEGTATRGWIDQALYRHRLAGKLKIAVETNSSNIAFAAIRADNLVGITACPAHGALTADLAVRSVGRWFGTARFVFVWNQGSEQMPVPRALADLIRRSATN